ncbi:MAG: hypothetical protein OEZ02_11070 [Anaerolineae bacterium]|nr:hypothetical protein [Anaerolineae bacterium]
MEKRITQPRLKTFFLLSSVAGAASISWLLSIPGEKQIGRVMGLSTTRMILLGGLLLPMVGMAVSAASLWRETAGAKRMVGRINNVLMRPNWAACLLFVAAGLAGLAVGYFTALFGLELVDISKETLMRLAPAVLWGLVFCVQLVYLLVGHFYEGENERVALGISAAVVAAGMLGFAVLVSQFWNFTIDDAYITFRYSENMVSGIGPTYNRTFPRAEGYTSFLWMLLATLPHLLGMDVVVFAKLFGVGVTLVLFVVVFLFAAAMDTKGAPPVNFVRASMAVFLLGIYPATAVHAVSGMETALYSMLLTLFVFCIVLGVQGNAKYLSIAPFVGLLLGLSRPEGNLITVLLLGYGIWQAGEQRGKVLRATLLGYVLPGGGYYFWRTAYYGLFFPLPFYAKVVNPSPLAGAASVGAFVWSQFPMIALLVMIALIKSSRELKVMLVSVGALLTFFLFPAHIIGYDWRFLHPAVPLILLMAATGAGVLLAGLRGQLQNVQGGLKGIKFAGLVFGLCFTLGASMLTGVTANIQEKLVYYQGIKNAHIRLGEALRNYPDNGGLPILAIADAGAAPYYSQWETIDTIGLNDRRIAEPVGTNLFDYVFSKNPALVIIISHDKHELVHDGSRPGPMYETSLAHGMVKLLTLRASDDYYLWVMGYADSDLAVYLEDALR